MLLKLASGNHINRTSMLFCTLVPATRFKGHSYIKPMIPRTRLMIWRVGKGFTAASKFLVRKSKKHLGQKKPSRAAAI